MSPKITERILRIALLPLTAALLVATGCGNGSLTSTGTQSSAETGPAFVVGTDAPMASVVSFPVTITSLTANPQGGSAGVCLISSCTSSTGVQVDFARFNGLQTLLDDHDLAAGTYTSVTIVLGSGSIGYLNVPTSGAPTIATMAAMFSPSNSITVQLANPLVVSATGGAPVGVRIDFDLAKSIQVNSSGAITGTVDPTFDVTTVARTDTGAHIDTLIGGVVTAPTGSAVTNSFTIQGPHGENFTIDTSSSTAWDGDASIAALEADGANAIVEVAGQMDPADQTLDADEVAILSDSNFYATGQITYVTAPTSSSKGGFDLYVRGLEPTNTGLTLGQLADVNLTGNEKYFIYAMHNPMTEFLFNADSLVAGQAVAMGGPASGAASATDVTVDRIHLRNWGFNGTVVAGSENSSQGTFQMQVTGFAGVLIPEKVTVYLGPACDFRYGFGAFNDLTDGASIRVVGLLLDNPSTGQVVLWARHVDGLNFTDMTATAWQ
jgi:hypothetical protein